MKTRHILTLSLIALFAFAATAKADTEKLTAEEGWTKVATMPTASEIAQNYYVFVDTSRDLMLGVAKGANQNTKWYSLGVYYQTSVEPTTSAMLSKTWMLETVGNGFALRNLEYSVSPFQTEWNAGWKFDTNDVYATANDWCKVLFAYADGSWTLQNGYYPSSGYLGPWDNGNFTNGAECAANKSGNNVGHFQIYAISRDQFKQNLLDAASSSNPVDVTPWYITNATFDQNRNGWTEEGSGGNNNTSLGCEIWHRSNFKIHQDVTVPAGTYRVSIQTAGSTSGYVYGTSGGTTQTAYASADAKDNFQNTVLAMIQDRTYGQITTTDITVSSGNGLEIGFADATNNQWDVFDNFKLYCTGLDLSGYADALAEAVSAASAFIATHVVPTAAENAISAVVTQNNQLWSTAKEYSTATLAINAIVSQYQNDTELQAAYAAYKTMRTNIQGLEDAGVYHYTDNGGAKTTLDAAITTANTAVEAATTASAINTQTANIRAAAMTFISSVTAEDGNPFNITFLASQRFSDFKKKDGSAAGEVTWALTNKPNGIPSFAESYEGTCATTGNVLYQTVSNLPAGYFRVNMYAMALYTPDRGFATEATEGDATRSFAFAGDQRTGLPIKFATSCDYTELGTLDVNVHLSAAGDLTFGVTKDANGSNWHFAQIIGIYYSNTPDLTELKNTRDALVSEAEGLQASNDYAMLTAAQQTALQNAIDEAIAANTFNDLNTVTLTTMPTAINTAKQLISQAKAGRADMIAALERFERDYNLTDGTDYRRLTMSAKAWTDLLTAVNNISLALDDISQASNYATLAEALTTQMDKTDTSLSLFKGYKAMAEGITAVFGGSSANDSQMDTDATEQTAIASMNEAFDAYAATQAEPINMNAFLGANLDFSAAHGSALNTTNSNAIYDIAGWEEAYTDVDTWTVLQNQHNDHVGQLYMRCNWTDKPTTVTVTKERMLPVGHYTLSMNWNSTLANMTNKSQYKLGSAEAVTIGEATTGEKTLTYEFEVTGQATPFNLTLGFQKTGSGDMPAQLIVDDISLTARHEAAVNDDFDDVTSLITNPSFETGDETGWTLNGKDPNGNDEFRTRDYWMSNKDGLYLMNVHQWWASSLSVTQTVEGVPCGVYQLSGVVATWEGRTVTFQGNEVSVETAGQGDATGIPVSLDVTIGLNRRLTITAGSTGQWWVAGHESETQTFFKLDNVRLICKTKYLDAVALPLPNDESTMLNADQWYYFDAPYYNDYWILGDISGMQYSTDAMVVPEAVTTNAVSRRMTLNQGRTYFKTNRNDATLRILSAKENITGSFTAVALNVDGLPKKVATFNLNPDGPGEEGTEKISRYLASKNYDFIGCSEDFNYNGTLMGSLNGNYSCGTVRNTLSVGDIDYLQLIQGNLRFDTDGLNLIWKNSTCSASGESWTEWESMTPDEGNQYVHKGYRHYDMQLGNSGQVIDVFILHMDAGDATPSRESQWRQLAGAVNAADATRPKLIIGDTNSRWTREDIAGNFMNLLNSNLNAADVWVQLCRNGIYPTVGTGDLNDSSNPTNFGNYEIVDKIIYINTTDPSTLQLQPQSFWIEQDYTYGHIDGTDDTTPLGDHHPVVVTFSYSRPGAELPLSITLSEDAADNDAVVAGNAGAVADVTLQRTLTAGQWNTFCVPFAISNDELKDAFGNAVAVAEYSETGSDNHSTVSFNTMATPAINANTPVLLKPATVSGGLPTGSYTFPHRTIVSGEAKVSGAGYFDFVGTYAATLTIAEGDYFISGNKLWRSSGATTVKGTRAYVKAKASNNNARIASFAIDGDVITGIEMATDAIGQNSADIYNLQGQRVLKATKGIYIKNGKKIIKK